MRIPLPDDRCPRLGTGVSRCIGLPLPVMMFLLMGPLAGCANPGSIEEADPESKVFTLACVTSTQGTDEAALLLDWELTVRPTLIEGGMPFAANLDGVARFDEAFLDLGQTVIEGGVKEVNAVTVNATVQVRSGATGADVILGLDPTLYPYRCDVGRTECDPNKDLPGVPGVRPNTDCQPEENLNPCGRFIGLPISDDCDPGGICAERGKQKQCSLNRFCITGDLRVPLDGGLGEYTAASEGVVLFGWSEDGNIEAKPMYTDPVGPISLRLTFGPIRWAQECVMRATTPDEDLISFTIETP
jgi:hypothetical protein